LLSHVTTCTVPLKLGVACPPLRGTWLHFNKEGRSMNDLFEEIPLTFHHKPLLVAGGAFDYHGIRKRGKDYDFILHPDDFFALYTSYGSSKSDLGDEVITIGVYEFSASFAGLSYEQLSRNAVKQGTHLVISLPYLLFTALTLSEHEPDNQKRRRDVALLLHKLVAKYP
jgi:hypothetical protein